VAPPLSRFEWERLIRQSELPSAMKLTGYALATYVNGNGSNAHPGVDLLVKATGLSRRTIITALAGLESEGLLIVTSKGGGKGMKRGTASVYCLASPGNGSPGRHRLQPGAAVAPGQEATS
jgi:hypothetical protein